MKTFTKFLLAATAIAVTAGAAQADALSGLKIDMQTLSEDQANSMVGGGNVFTHDGDNIHAIYVKPTADAPAVVAPQTVLTWSGYVRVAVVGGHDNNTIGANGFTGVAGNASNAYPVDLFSREKLKVTGVTQTDLGELGAAISIRTNTTSAGAGWNETDNSYNGGRSTVTSDGYYGWLKSGNIVFSGGNGSLIGGTGSLLYNTFTFDSICTCQSNFGNDGWGAISIPRNGSPFGNSSKNTPVTATLGYMDGPIVAAIGLEDAGTQNVGAVGNTNAAGPGLGFTGKIAYNNNLKAGPFGAELSAGYFSSGVGAANPTGNNAAWSIIGGASYKLDPITLGASLGTGNVGAYGGTGTVGNFSTYTTQVLANSGYTIGQAYAVVTLAPGISTELAFVHDFGSDAGDMMNGASLYQAGLYWKPKKQFTLGAEGQFQSGGGNDGGYTLGTVARWDF